MNQAVHKYIFAAISGADPENNQQPREIFAACTMCASTVLRD